MATSHPVLCTQPVKPSPPPQLSSLLHVHPGAAAPNPPSFHVLSIFLISQTFQYIPISFLSPKTNAAWIFADPSNLAPLCPWNQACYALGPCAQLSYLSTFLCSGCIRQVVMTDGPRDFRLCEQTGVAYNLLVAGTCSPCVVSWGGGDRVSVCCRLGATLSSSLAMYVLPRSPEPEEDAGSCVPAMATHILGLSHPSG